MENTTKVCRKCGVEKPDTAEFYAKSGRVKQSLTSDCKACRRDDERARNALKPKKVYSRAPRSTKRCQKCCQQKPKELFRVSSRVAKDGRGRTCTPCIEIGKKEKAAGKLLKAARVSALEQKACSACAQMLPMTEEFFARSSKEYSGFKSRCKACISAGNKAAYRADPESFREAGRQVVSARKRRDPIGFSLQQRAKKLRRREHELRAQEDGRLTAALLREIVDLQEHLCWYCEVEVNFDPSNNLTQATFDHLLPITKGGTNARGNLVCACRSCNCSKASQWGWEWLGITKEEWEASKGRGKRVLIQHQVA